eukprot:g7151.t1
MQTRFPFISCSLRRAYLRDNRPPPPRLGAPKSPLSIDAKEYPWTHRDTRCVEEIFGIEVEDPYRWLENPDSPQTAAFIESQNFMSTTIFEQCPSRETFKKLFTQLYNYPKYGCPHKEGNKYYFYNKSGLENQHSVYVHDGDFNTARLFLDPNEWSEDGSISLDAVFFSKQACYMGYTITTGGSDWQKIKILELREQGGYTELKDEIEFAKFTEVTWTHDELGFIYGRLPDPNIVSNGVLGRENQAYNSFHLCYHVLGTPQEQDLIIYQRQGKDLWFYDTEITNDGRYMIISSAPGCTLGNEVAYLDLHELVRLPNGVLDFRDCMRKVKDLVKDINASYQYIANEGTVFTFKTNKNAPRYKVVQVDLQTPKQWKDVIPEHECDVLQWACATKGDFMVVCYLRDVANVLEVRKITTGEKLGTIPIPQFGAITSFSSKRELSEIFFTFQSFIHPKTIYKYNVELGELEVVHKTKIPKFNPDDYETKRVFVKSKDSKVQIPMFISHKKGIEKNKENPTILNGYGGFNVNVLPTFSIASIAFMLGYNGVIASANIRGGGEYGDEWRNGGCLDKKQNCFDDFHSCSEYLIDHKYCDASRLCIQGGSNGGLLVAACANQRPDLYGCVICQVGVLDMLRYHLFTAGAAWIPEYGNPDVVSDFEFLFKYSPLHNIRVPEGGTQLYPSMILTTGDQDDRVSPLHTLKFVAQLQYVFKSIPRIEQTNPIIARIETQTGHGHGKPTSMIIQEYVDVLAFVATTLRASWNGEMLV